MKVVLFGANGQVGREIVDAAASRKIELIPIYRADADLLHPGAAAKIIETHRPQSVINAAAWTAVDLAEKESAAAERLNTQAPREIAEACAKRGARFIHISTDYVFDGASSAAPLDEEAPTAPLNLYGATKLRGEEAVLKASPHAIIMRTSWVYSPSGSNFVKTMLRLGEANRSLNIVADQLGGPTPASAIAAACLRIAEEPNGPGGVYHFQGAPAASWADFAAAIFAASGQDVRVNQITSAEYPTPARRPLYTVLNCSKIHRDYGLEQPDWRADLPRTIALIREVAAR